MSIIINYIFTIAKKLQKSIKWHFDCCDYFHYDCFHYGCFYYIVATHFVSYSNVLDSNVSILPRSIYQDYVAFLVSVSYFDYS